MAPTASPATGLQYDYKQTTELLIAKADARTGDRWTARAIRQGDSDLWTFALLPDEAANGDKQAFGTYIFHLLDVMRTIQLAAAPVSGTAESFGFTPPLFDLRWKADGKEFSIELGGPVKTADGQFAGLYASIDGKTEIAQGAALKMLDMLASFDDLRLRTLVTFSSDDVDEIEIPKLRFYAQRDGDHWTDHKHRPLKDDVEGLLEYATHLRISKFVDAADAQRPLEALLTQKPAYTISFRGRGKQLGTLRFAKSAGNVVADSSTRATSSGTLAPFVVYPNALDSLAGFTLRKGAP